MDILETRGIYRVGIDYEQGPDEPFNDFASPLLRIDRSNRASFVDKGTMRPRDDEVYYYAIEKLVHWRAVDPVTDDYDYAEFPDRDTWETVASLGSYYGYDYAVREARAAFEEYLDQQKGD